MREKWKLALKRCARAQRNVVRLAEQRTESAENALREVIADADRKLSDASRALTEVELRSQRRRTRRWPRKFVRR